MLEVQYGNAKIRTAQDLLRLVFVHVGCDLPLRQTVAVVGASGGLQLSAMRLHKKMQRDASYLDALIARMVPIGEHARPQLWTGFEMVAVDASTVCGPGPRNTEPQGMNDERRAQLEGLGGQSCTHGVKFCLSGYGRACRSWNQACRTKGSDQREPEWTESSLLDGVHVCPRPKGVNVGAVAPH